MILLLIRLSTEKKVKFLIPIQGYVSQGKIFHELSVTNLSQASMKAGFKQSRQLIFTVCLPSDPTFMASKP